MIEWLNIVLSGVLAFAAGWASMSPRVRVGLIAQIGLAMVSIGFLGTFLISLQPYSYLTGAANSIVHIGLVICGVGYARRYRKNGPKRRVSDWVELKDGADSGYPFNCPDTQPTSPGALDSDSGRLE